MLMYSRSNVSAMNIWPNGDLYTHASYTLVCTHIAYAQIQTCSAITVIMHVFWATRVTEPSAVTTVYPFRVSITVLSFLTATQTLLPSLGAVLHHQCIKTGPGDSRRLLCDWVKTVCTWGTESQRPYFSWVPLSHDLVPLLISSKKAYNKLTEKEIWQMQNIIGARGGVNCICVYFSCRILFRHWSFPHPISSSRTGDPPISICVYIYI